MLLDWLLTILSILSVAMKPMILYWSKTRFSCNSWIILVSHPPTGQISLNLFVDTPIGGEICLQLPGSHDTTGVSGYLLEDSDKYY